MRSLLMLLAISSAVLTSLSAIPGAHEPRGASGFFASGLHGAPLPGGQANKKCGSGQGGPTCTGYSINTCQLLEHAEDGRVTTICVEYVP